MEESNNKKIHEEVQQMQAQEATRQGFTEEDLQYMEGFLKLNYTMHKDHILNLIAEIRRLQSELANAKVHAEVQAGQAREAAYNEVIDFAKIQREDIQVLYNQTKDIELLGVVAGAQSVESHAKEMLDKMLKQAEQAGKE